MSAEIRLDDIETPAFKQSPPNAPLQPVEVPLSSFQAAEADDVALRLHGRFEIARFPEEGGKVNRREK
jgi:hypothetical protein